MIALPVIFAAMILAVLAIILAPLWRGAHDVVARGDFDRAVYRDQLAELERDLARGLIVEGEARAARIEIQRRLLATETTAASPDATSRRSPRLALALTLLIAVAGAALYMRLGSPTVPDTPFASRTATQPTMAGAAPHTDMKAAAQGLAEKLQADPSNRENWALYARTEASLGDWNKASTGFRHAMELGDTSVDIYESYGEMLVLAGGGIVSPAARDSFLKALTTEPRSQVARYYLALADGQAGETQKAISAWLALAAEIPEDSPMRSGIARGIQSAALSAGIAAPPLPKGLPADAPAASGSGPSPDQMEAAATMPAGDREQMIRGMIAKLAARLETEPNDLDGWLRLGRAYSVEGETDKAFDAFDHAVKVKPDDPGIKLQAVSILLSRLQPDDPLPMRAVALLHEAAALAPDAPEVLWYLGVVASHEGKSTEARQDWTRLLATLPKDGEDYKVVQSALAELKSP